MKPDKLDYFETHAPNLFKKLVDDFGYILEEIKTAEINGEPWSKKLIYLHAENNFKIEIKQEPYYTDYGFSIFIHNLTNDDYNILYNIPHERQDDDSEFLASAADEFFSSTIVIDLLKGNWSTLGRILIQK